MCDRQPKVRPLRCTRGGGWISLLLIAVMAAPAQAGESGRRSPQPASRKAEPAPSKAKDEVAKRPDDLSPSTVGLDKMAVTHGKRDARAGTPSKHATKQTTVAKDQPATRSHTDSVPKETSSNGGSKDVRRSTEAPKNQPATKRNSDFTPTSTAPKGEPTHVEHGGRMNKDQPATERNTKRTPTSTAAEHSPADGKRSVTGESHAKQEMPQMPPAAVKRVRQVAIEPPKGNAHPPNRDESEAAEERAPPAADFQRDEPDTGLDGVTATDRVETPADDGSQAAPAEAPMAAVPDTGAQVDSGRPFPASPALPIPVALPTFPAPSRAQPAIQDAPPSAALLEGGTPPLVIPPTPRGKPYVALSAPLLDPRSEVGPSVTPAETTGKVDAGLARQIERPGDAHSITAATGPASAVQVRPGAADAVKTPPATKPVPTGPLPAALSSPLGQLQPLAGNAQIPPHALTAAAHSLTIKGSDASQKAARDSLPDGTLTRGSPEPVPAPDEPTEVPAASSAPSSGGGGAAAILIAITLSLGSSLTQSLGLLIFTWRQPALASLIERPD